MKVCGYCNKEYDKTESKCPYCGSTMVKMDHTTSGQDEYNKIEAEIKRKRQTRSAIIIGAVVCVLIALIVGITMLVGFINDPQRDIDKTAEQMYATAQEYVDAGDYESALATADRINSQWSDYYKLDSLRAEAVKGQLNETISEYEAEGNYEAVIKYIDENVEDISSDKEIEEIYKNSVLKYKEAAINKADEYLANKDYSAAVSVLTTATRLVGSDKALDAKMFECNKAEILNQIAIYKNEGNYAKAIEYINENLDIINNDSDILIELSACENSYRNKIISDAEEVYDSEGYEGALSIINRGLSVLTDDSVLQKEKEAYEACVPIDLTTLEPFHVSGAGIGNINSVYDTLGNCYNTGMRGWMGVSDGDYSRTYNIGQKFNTLTAVGIVLDSDKGSKYTATIRFYGDGVLLYSKNVTSDMKPFDIKVDITGVEDLKVELYGQGNMGTSGIDATICDVMLQKSK